jgi:hypothetical protein
MKTAAQVQWRPNQDGTMLRLELKGATLEDHIRAVVDTAPSLASGQGERLAALLCPRVRWADDDPKRADHRGQAA